MNMIKLIYHNEMLLLIRNKFLALPLIINFICWGYVIFSYENQPVHYQELAAVFYTSFQWILMLNLFIVGLLSVHMARKDHESEFEHLVVTYKVRNMEWVAGKWLVTQTYGLCITFITMLIQGIWFYSGSMSMGEWIENLLFVFLQMEGALFLLISIGFLFGIWIKNMLAYIVIPTLLAVVFIQSENSKSLSTNASINVLSLYETMFMSSPFEGIWGIHRVFENAIIHQTIVILLGIIFILVTLQLFRPNRRLKSEKNIALIVIIILIIPTIVVSGFRYAQYHDAHNQYANLGKQYLMDGEEYISNYYESKSDFMKNDFSIERTDLTIQFPDRNQIDVKSKLAVKYNGNAAVHEVYLTLHHQLKVTDCISDAEITCSREEDFLIVRFQDEIHPNEQFELILNYHGDIKQYRNDGMLEHSFIESNRVYLPKEAGWYPLIGKRYLAKSTENHGQPFVQFELRNGGLVEDYPTEFIVKIINEENNIPIALTVPQVRDGLYKGTSQYGLSLIGGNFEEVMVNQTRVVGHPDILIGAQKTTEMYLEGTNYIEEWLEVPMVPKVIYILNHDHSYLTQSTPSLEFIAWSVDDIEYLNYSMMSYRLVNVLTDNQSSQSEDVQLLKMAMVWTLFNRFQVDTGSNQFDSYANQLPQLANLVEILNRYDEQGEEHFQQVVKFLFTQYEQLDDKDNFDLEDALSRYEGENAK